MCIKIHIIKWKKPVSKDYKIWFKLHDIIGKDKMTEIVKELVVASR